MRIGSHEYANEADDDNIPKPAQSLGTGVPRQKLGINRHKCLLLHCDAAVSSVYAAKHKINKLTFFAKAEIIKKYNSISCGFCKKKTHSKQFSAKHVGKISAILL